jgi:hypothetical protein
LVFGAVAGTSPASSEESLLTWIVQSVSTDEEGGMIQAGLGTPHAGAELAEGQLVSTGPGETMVLSNGRDLVTLNPGTRVEIGDHDSATPEANLELKSGTVHVKAGKRQAGQTFSVEAPYLVATVKGTQFDVSTGGDVSAVSVTEGRVGVSATAGGGGVDVTPGKSARVAAGAVGAPDLMETPAGGIIDVLGETTQTASNIGGGVSPGSDPLGGDGADSDGSGDGSGGDTGGSGPSGGDTDGDTSGSSTGSVGGAVSGTTGAVGGAVSGATDAVGGAISDTTGAVGDAVGGDLGDAVSDVGGAVGGAVSGVGGAVGGALGGLGGAAGGLLGGKK